MLLADIEAEVAYIFMLKNCFCTPADRKLQAFFLVDNFRGCPVVHAYAHADDSGGSLLTFVTCSTQPKEECDHVATPPPRSTIGPDPIPVRDLSGLRHQNIILLYSTQLPE